MITDMEYEEIEPISCLPGVGLVQQHINDPNYWQWASTIYGEFLNSVIELRSDEFVISIDINGVAIQTHWYMGIQPSDEGPHTSDVTIRNTDNFCIIASFQMNIVDERNNSIAESAVAIDKMFPDTSVYYGWGFENTLLSFPSRNMRQYHRVRIRLHMFNFVVF